MPILNIYKPKGLTPLQTINLLRKKLPEYKDKKIGFAGRLDPLAHGVLLLMIDEETTKQREKYLNLPKEYEFKAVFGISTDTYDVLGLINVIANVVKQSPDEKIASSFSTPRNDGELKTRIETFIQSKLGKQLQPYPPYSSKTVHGKPLYQWAREKKLSEIEIPTREIEIYETTLLETNSIPAKKLKKEIFKQIDTVSGDFRQEKIKNTWNTFFANNQRLKTNNRLQTARFKIACSSGTYVRSFIDELGKFTGLEATSLEILRTKVGEYSIKHSLQFT